MPWSWGGADLPFVSVNRFRKDVLGEKNSEQNIDCISTAKTSAGILYSPLKVWQIQKHQEAYSIKKWDEETEKWNGMK